MTITARYEPDEMTVAESRVTFTKKKKKNELKKSTDVQELRYRHMKVTRILILFLSHLIQSNFHI